MQTNQYPNTTTVIGENDYIDVDKYISAGVYQSNKMSGASVINQLGSNFANTNLTLTGNRSHSFDGNILGFTDIERFVMFANTAPTPGVSSFESTGYGVTRLDVTHEFKSQLGTTSKMFGDNTTRFYNGVGIGASGEITRCLNVNATSGVYGVYSLSNNFPAGYFNSSASYGIEANGTFGGVFTGSTAGLDSTSTAGIAGAFSTSSGKSIVATGRIEVNTVGYSPTNNPSALLQLESITQGFLPPRMTTANINAISSLSEGLVVYNTTIKHLCCYQNGAWVKFSHSPM